MLLGRPVNSDGVKTVDPIGRAGRHLAWFFVIAWSLAPLFVRAQDEQWESLIRAAESAYEHGDFHQALEKAEDALRAAEVFGEKDERYIRTLVVLGVYNRRLERLGAAESHYKRALQLYEETLGPIHENVAAVLANLGIIRDMQRRYSEAEEYYRRALRIDELVYGPDHPYVASDLSNLAMTYKGSGRSDDAELALKRALSIYEKAGEANDVHMANTLSALGTLYFDQGRYTEAEPLLERALRMFTALYGSDHKYVWYIQSRLTGIERGLRRSTVDPEKVGFER